MWPILYPAADAAEMESNSSTTAPVSGDSASTAIRALRARSNTPCEGVFPFRRVLNLDRCSGERGPRFFPFCARLILSRAPGDLGFLIFWRVSSVIFRPLFAAAIFAFASVE